MCTIGFTITYEDLDTDLVYNWEGEYRKMGTSEWIPFQFEWNNPQTPNIIEQGIYEMRIRIFDGRVWSDWFYTEFAVGCAAFTIGYSEGYNA